MTKPQKHSSPFSDVDPVVRQRMARIRKTSTRPELLVREAVRALGFGYRLNRRDLPGTPDLAFIGRRKAIFVHGCFWHQHGCALTGRTPRTRAEYWEPKLRRNVERDRETIVKLEAIGYSVLVIWECEVKDAGMVERIRAFLSHQIFRAS